MKNINSYPLSVITAEYGRQKVKQSDKVSCTVTGTTPSGRHGEGFGTFVQLRNYLAFHPCLSANETRALSFLMSECSWADMAEARASICHQDLKQTDIQEAIGCSKKTTAIALANLEKFGLISIKSLNRGNGKKVYSILPGTDSGWKMLGDVDRIWSRDKKKRYDLGKWTDIRSCKNQENGTSYTGFQLAEIWRQKVVSGQVTKDSDIPLEMDLMFHDLGVTFYKMRSSRNNGDFERRLESEDRLKSKKRTKNVSKMKLEKDQKEVILVHESTKTGVNYYPESEKNVGTFLPQKKIKKVINNSRKPSPARINQIKKVNPSRARNIIYISNNININNNIQKSDSQKRESASKEIMNLDTLGKLTDLINSIQTKETPKKLSKKKILNYENLSNPSFGFTLPKKEIEKASSIQIIDRYLQKMNEKYPQVLVSNFMLFEKKQLKEKAIQFGLDNMLLMVDYLFENWSWLQKQIKNVSKYPPKTFIYSANWVEKYVNMAISKEQPENWNDLTNMQLANQVIDEEAQLEAAKLLGFDVEYERIRLEQEKEANQESEPRIYDKDGNDIEAMKFAAKALGIEWTPNL